MSSYSAEARPKQSAPNVSAASEKLEEMASVEARQLCESFDAFAQGDPQEQSELSESRLQMALRLTALLEAVTALDRLQACNRCPHCGERIAL